MDGTRIGSLIAGKYTLAALVSAQATAEVYQALQHPLDRWVTFKLLNRAASKDPTLVERFHREAAVISKLRSPHSVSLIEFGQTPDRQLYWVTEWLDGRRLDQHLFEEGALGAALTTRLIHQVSSALAEAHAMGVVHRNLKPSTIFLEHRQRQDHVRVLDFGLAKLLESPSLTLVGQWIGAPRYACPEQLRGEVVDQRSDIYSLGVVAYECLCGEALFEATDPFEIAFRHLHEAPVPLVDRGCLGPSWLLKLVHQMLSKAPDNRPASAQALVDVTSRVEALEIMAL